jgi:hypothetical protein
MTNVFLGSKCAFSGNCNNATREVWEYRPPDDHGLASTTVSMRY